MKTSVLVALVLVCSSASLAQAPSPDVKLISDTLVVQADGRYEADPDLATLSFSVFAQDKNLKQTYDQASQSMQKIAQIAEKNGLKKDDITLGVLTVRPYYEGDRKKRAKSYTVQGQITLRVKDFSKLGPLLEDSVEDGITDFRSLTYSLADEEATRHHAAAAAMRSAMGRATVVLERKGQKVGTLRFANLDIKQMGGCLQHGRIFSGRIQRLQHQRSSPVIAIGRSWLVRRGEKTNRAATAASATGENHR